ncbi:MAG: Asp-tRNA(Asn)/Glu-tRNA(Gln) amidotransferase subunit GatA, partial [Luminiphilus sp.]|nr:Asp-tRNA(Asn)/Glu-tRNA(Gln) amidotransferase subunit GatA [Luminiphilus sp.]
MIDSALLNASVSELHQLLTTRQVSSAELTKGYLERIDLLNGKLNAVVTVCAEQAIEDASRADERRTRGEGNILTGIPLLHKDIFCTQGVTTTCGSRMLEHFVPAYDATVVARLKAAGVVMLGKCNMDEFAMGSSNETSFFGAVKNPWDTNCVPGGSSGGSAAALAAGMAPLVTGTDTGGSIRQPASLCGVTGLKPTYGRVSRLGIIAFASSLDQAGPMARSAADCAHMLTAISGLDTGDSTSADRAVPDFFSELTGDISGLRIGMPREYFNDDLDSEVRAQVMSALTELEKAGAQLVDIDLPHSHY